MRRDGGLGNPYRGARTGAIAGVARFLLSSEPVHSTALRLLACVALAGQLQWLPGTLICDCHRQQSPSHCAQQTAMTSPMIGPAHAPMAHACMLAGVCAVQAPALPAPGSVIVAYSATVPGPAGAPAALRSFTSAPAPPPPQG